MSFKGYPAELIQFPALEKYIDQQMSFAWKHDEVSLNTDLTTYKGFSDNTKRLLKNIFSFLTQIDIEVQGCYASYVPKVFGAISNCPVAYGLFITFAQAELVHVRAYANLIEELTGDPGIMQGYLNKEVFKSKIQSITKSLVNADKSDVLNKSLKDLLDFTVRHEGLSLFSLFFILYAFEAEKKLSNTCTIIDLSMRDENLHVSAMANLCRSLIDVTYKSDKPNMSKEEWFNRYKEFTKTAGENELEKEQLIVETIKEGVNLDLLKEELPTLHYAITNIHLMSEWLLKFRLKDIFQEEDELPPIPFKYMENAFASAYTTSVTIGGNLGEPNSAYQTAKFQDPSNGLNKILSGY